MKECMVPNARYGFGNGNGGEGRAITERIVSNARYGVADGDGGEIPTAHKRTISNTGYRIGGTIVCNACRDVDLARFIRVVTITIYKISYFHGVFTRDIVIQSAGLEIVGEGGGCGAEHGQQKNR